MNNFNSVGNTMSMYPQRNQFSSYFNPASGASASTNNIVWVQGIEGAKAWQLSPNSMVILLDSEAEGKMYIKVSDNIGMSSLRVFNYAEEVAPPAKELVTINNDLDLSQYVKRDELNTLVKELMAKNEQSVPTVTIPKQPKVVSTTTTTK